MLRPPGSTVSGSLDEYVLHMPRCCRQVLQVRGQLRKSSFVSLGKPVSNHDDLEQVASTHVAATDDDPKNKRPRQKKRLSFAKQYQEQRRPSGVDKVLETLFSTTRGRIQTLDISRYSRMPIAQSSELAPAQGQTPEDSGYPRLPREQPLEPATYAKSVDHRLQELHAQLQQGTTTLESIWTSCEELLGQNSWRLSTESQRGHEHSSSTLPLFRDILLGVCSKQRITIQGVTTTPADVIKVYQKHGVMRYWWHEVLWSQLAQALRLKYQKKIKQTEEEASLEIIPSAGIKTLLEEILQVWNLFMQEYSAVPASVSVQGDLTASSGDAIEAQVPLPREMASQFQSLIPKHPQRMQTRQMSAAAVLTLDCLESENHYGVTYLIRFFRTLKKGCRLDPQIAKRSLAEAGVPLSIIEEALSSWGSSLAEAGMQPSTQKGRTKSANVKTLDWSKKATSSRLADIGAVYKRSNPEEAFEYWQSFQNHLKTHGYGDQESTDLIFIRFLRTFWALRRSNHAIEVWNVMVNMGRTPSQMHWNAMLLGCYPVNDSQSMQEIWANMWRSGLEPDIFTWTTYIYGLIKCNKTQDGFAVLEQLGRSWKKEPPAAGLANMSSDEISQKTDIKGDIRLHPVNAALSALVDREKYDLTQTVIRWALSQGLRLETSTFNILLRPLVRVGTQDQIQSHLQLMGTHNCIPDIVTYTILLNGLISNPDSPFNHLPPEDQESTITTILTKMETQNLNLTPQTYTILLNGLIGKPTSTTQTPRIVNIPLAKLILNHMSARHIPPSPHLYTILITHYFSRKPPDLPAINSLLTSIHSSRSTTHLPDTVFYDRLIEGYASLGEIEKALKILREIPKRGKTPGYVALQVLLRKMAEMGEWDLCRELVEDVEREGGLLRHGVGGWRGKGQWWALVDELRGRGLLDDGVER